MHTHTQDSMNAIGCAICSDFVYEIVYYAIANSSIVASKYDSWLSINHVLITLAPRFFLCDIVLTREK